MPHSPDGAALRPGARRHRALPRPLALRWGLLVLVAMLAIAPGLPDAAAAAGPGNLAGTLPGTGTIQSTPTGTMARAPIPTTFPSANADPFTSAAAAMAADDRAAKRARLALLRDTDAPVATLAPLVVEQGSLALHWSDTDGEGSGIVARTVRLERAPATATACGEFDVLGAIELGTGDYAKGAITLGPPPTSGCLRASVELVDRAGLRSIAVGDPMRIEPNVKPAAARAPWTGGFNLYRRTAFVTQKDFKWCVAASVQMMVNIVRHKTDRTAATQKRMIAYAQSNDDGPYGPGGGTDVTGWIVALRHFGAGRYRAVGARTPAAALRIAATAMRQMGRPAGMLVMDGQHAWVLHGFESRTDPLHDRHAKVTSVRVSGPLYPIQQKHGYDLRPNTELSIRALARFFRPSTVGGLVGRYVVIVPTH